jgi:MFS transporter, FHS family, L-fucose permease
MSKKGLFIMPDGKSLAVTFFLVASLFLLWGFCNGMIDTMDKHFQDQLHLTKAQSAWVQFAHYMGYALMALPAGMLTRKLGYKGGIIFGLLLVACGGFWFMPATKIAAFWAFLMGVCLIAMGLTVLETVANPYTTVLGPKEYGATRINLAQSFNGVGWIFGPIIGGAYFYSEGGTEVAQGQLYIPYLGVGIIVLILAVLFMFAKVPDIKVEDAYHTDDADTTTASGGSTAKISHFGLTFALMFLNVAALGLTLFLVCHTILPALGLENAVQPVLYVLIALLLIAAPILFSSAKKLTEHSMWAQAHFSGATLSQFVYVAAQAGIFSFFINTMTTDHKTGFTIVPGMRGGMDARMNHAAESLRHVIGNVPLIGRFPNWLTGWFTTDAQGIFHISDKGAANLASVAFVFFLVGRLFGSWLLKRLPAHKVLGTFAVLNIGVCGLIIANLGWLSVFGVFLSYFFMSVMYPTIFALGIFGLGAQSQKKAAAFIVMSITGGALMPKVMGYLGDVYNMATGYWMPLVCFIFIALYAFSWSKLSRSEGLIGVSAGKGH